MTVIAAGMDYRNKNEAIRDLERRLDSMKTMYDIATSSGSAAHAQAMALRSVLSDAFRELGRALYHHDQWYVQFYEGDE